MAWRWLRPLILGGVGALAACGPAEPTLTASTPTVPSSAETSTPFLPRGFDNLPTPSGIVGPTPGAAVSLPSVAPERIELSVVLERLNLMREQEGAAELIRDGSLDEIAGNRALSLAAAQALSHVTAGGQVAEAEGALAAAGFGGRLGEVVLSGPSDDADLLGALLRTILTNPENRAVVLDEGFAAAGLGLAEAEGRLYVVLLVVESAPGPSASAED